MLDFDLRNGSLRRKYDGLKYAVKKLDDIGFDMSLAHWRTQIKRSHDKMDATHLPEQGLVSNKANSITMDVVGDHSAETGLPSNESSKGDLLIPEADIEDIRLRMDLSDQRREEVIKRSRDVQKLSKQAIFSIHRGNVVEAEKKVSAAKTIILEIKSTTDKVCLFVPLLP